jgi:hypothetical protein
MKGRILHMVVDLLTDKGGTPVEHLPSSPDLVPCDFRHFYYSNMSYVGTNSALTLSETIHCHYSMQDVWI